MRMHRRTRAETKFAKHAPRICHGPPPCPRCSGPTVRLDLIFRRCESCGEKTRGEVKTTDLCVSWNADTRPLMVANGDSGAHGVNPHQVNTGGPK